MAMINLRVDDKIKKDADKTFAEMGLTTSTAIKMFLVKSIREQRIPFEVSIENSDPFYSKENILELKRRKKNIENGTSKLKEHELIEDDEEEDLDR